MLRAGALFVAVTISFVLAVLISLLIVLAFHYKIQNRENLVQKKLERNVSSAFTLLMARAQENEEIKTTDLYGEETDSVRILHKHWGVYEMAAVSAFSGQYNISKTAQYGYVPDELASPAIYLMDVNAPLYVCGKTKITGTCYLPEQRALIDYILNRGYEGKHRVNGEIKKSTNALPPLNKKICKKIFQLFSGNFPADCKELNLQEQDTIAGSFMDPTLLVRATGSLYLSGKYLSGNVIIYSGKEIVVESNSQLDGVILLAKQIRVKKNFRGIFRDSPSIPL